MRVPHQPKKNFWTIRNLNTQRVVIKTSVAVLIFCVVATIGIARLKTHFTEKTILPNQANLTVASQDNSDSTASAVTTVHALITTVALNTGDAFEADSVKVVTRPADMLPSDFLTSVEDLQGSVALGPISANMPVSRAMLGNAVAVIPTTLGSTSATTADDIIFALAKHSIAFDLNFTAPTPPRGTRIEISSTLPNGEHAIITNQAWISASQGTHAIVLVSPDAGAVLQAFKSIPLQFEPMSNG